MVIHLSVRKAMVVSQKHAAGLHACTYEGTSSHSNLAWGRMA